MSQNFYSILFTDALEKGTLNEVKIFQRDVIV